MPSTSSSPALNKTILFTESYERMDAADAQTQMSLLLFGLSLVITLVTFLGSLYSLLSLLRMRNKTSLSLIVASMSIDDLISVVPLSLFMTVQWEVDSAHKSGARCTLAGLLYIFQGISSNLKASLMVVYTFYITKRFGVFQSAKRPLRIVWAILAVWVASLVVSILPVCGWGSFSPTDMGCFADSTSSYTVLLFVLYSVCFCVLVAFSVPLTHQLLCSDGHQRSIHPSYLEIARQHVGQGAAPVCDIPSLSGQDSLDKTFRSYIERTENSLHLNNKVETHTCSSPPAQYQKDAIQSDRDSPVFFAQKRFSLILAMIRNMLWMPMMIQIFVSHVLHFKSSSFETLGFILTLLSAAVTPVFVLSERWLHLPCGCFINCRREAYSLSYPTMGEPLSTTKKRGFEFNLSFQQGYGIYKIAQANHSGPEKDLYHNLLNCEANSRKATQTDLSRASGCAQLEFSTTPWEDSSLHTARHKPSGPGQAEQDGFVCCTTEYVQDENNDTSSVFEGPERRLSHEECRKVELSDWEWCRSKSERTPRQRSGGGLAIPLCAFQGTVSLHAPTGKTLSLSTYEVSSDGFKISPTSKKIEVYRSKSVGHEPSAEESPNSIADTNVKIHLEVLEICDNEEAMDTVSIVSNISQSSAHARSPSLRYSRRENRFVSCDLGETASYSLFIPTNNPDSDINITIPDTVEAHRQNSKKQHQDKSGYREEIQLLNEAYRKQEENPQN
ncbi:probable G-protein coupled receptor 149 [Amia ocellicauda]|uniref:probable G-protein coupled receptor 149 n=1 Tax=Amia ocellicauda TaxID=2972642 RepID=UPI0034638D14